MNPQVTLVKRTDQEATYRAALVLVETIDRTLAGGGHYRSRSGRLLLTQDQVIAAILTDDLATPQTRPARAAAQLHLDGLMPAACAGLLESVPGSGAG